MEFMAVIVVAFLGYGLSKRVTALERWRDVQEAVAKSKTIVVALIALSFCSIASAQSVPGAQSMDLLPPTRGWFKNPDGSCVQCSIGMAGVHCNDLNAASLLWDSAYGSAERGGSWPSRVESYFDKRGIKAWSITGNSISDTIPWLEWSARTGRLAAFGAGQAHFQTLYGRDFDRKLWFVCNNNSTDKIDQYDDNQFRNLHSQGPCWCVVLEKSSSPPPQMLQWWK